MAQTIDYYFTPISPWSYLGTNKLAEIARKKGVAIHFKPVHLPTLFKETGTPPLAQRPKARQDYRLVELARWPQQRDLPLVMHPAYFPADDSFANGVIIAAVEKGISQDEIFALLLKLHQLVWAEDANIADQAVVASAVAALGLPQELLESAASEAVKETLMLNTREAIDRGVFGLPSYWVGDEQYWGQDRLELLESRLG